MNMFSFGSSSNSNSNSSSSLRVIDMDDLLRDYESRNIPPPTCWERLKSVFRAS